MKLTDKQKELIKDEYNKFIELQYAGKSKEERQELGQFFTPAELTIKLLEQYDEFKEDDTLLDPTMGAGGLLAAAIIAGLVKPENVYGIEYDSMIFNVAKERLIKLGVDKKYFTDVSKFNNPCDEKDCKYENHFYWGDALKDISYDFPKHEEKFAAIPGMVSLF